MDEKSELKENCPRVLPKKERPFLVPFHQIGAVLKLRLMRRERPEDEKDTRKMLIVSMEGNILIVFPRVRPALDEARIISKDNALQVILFPAVIEVETVNKNHPVDSREWFYWTADRQPLETHLPVEDPEHCFRVDVLHVFQTI